MDNERTAYIIMKYNRKKPLRRLIVASFDVKFAMTENASVSLRMWDLQHLVYCFGSI